MRPMGASLALRPPPSQRNHVGPSLPPPSRDGQPPSAEVTTLQVGGLERMAWSNAYKPFTCGIGWAAEVTTVQVRWLADRWSDGVTTDCLVMCFPEAMSARGYHLS
jgi:hypothetical protein